MKRRARITSSAILSWLCLIALVCPRGLSQSYVDLEKAPFNYGETVANNRISRLLAKLDTQQTKLVFTTEHGYLRSPLKALDIEESSQTLVFSKTSMQIRHISRNNPRAIYFNDDTYVGWIHGSSLIEMSTTDPKLGTAFYSFEMNRAGPRIRRGNYECLGCHATSMTQGIPGHVVRSVFPT